MYVIEIIEIFTKKLEAFLEAFAAPSDYKNLYPFVYWLVIPRLAFLKKSLEAHYKLRDTPLKKKKLKKKKVFYIVYYVYLISYTYIQHNICIYIPYKMYIYCIHMI